MLILCDVFRWFCCSDGHVAWTMVYENKYIFKIQYTIYNSLAWTHSWVKLCSSQWLPQQVAHLCSTCLSLAVTFRLFTSTRPMAEPDLLLGFRHAALACGGLRVLTCALASGSEAGCRNLEAPTIFYCSFKAQFQYLPIFTNPFHIVPFSPQTRKMFFLSPILTSASASCTLESLAL